LLLWLGVAITQPSVGGAFEQIDKNKGGKPPAGGLEPAHRAAFQMFDKNNDGRLSLEELPRPLRPSFNKIDRNKDGSLSPDELGAFLRMAESPTKLTDSVRLEKNIPYAGSDNPRQQLDLIVPKKQQGDKPLPVIVYIFGGGWQTGDKAQGYSLLNAAVARGDCAGITINYRLSGEAIWPAQIHDCKAAIRWVRANAKKYNFDPDRIGVIGASSGGHLAIMLATSGGVESLEGNLGPYKGTSSRVCCAVDYSGPTDLLAMGDYPSQIQHIAPDSPGSRLVGGALPDRKELARSASPITYVSKDGAPTLVIHGDADRLVPFNQSERFAKALKDVGVDCVFLRVKGGDHFLFGNPEIERRVQQFFAKHLRGRKVVTISEEPVPDDALWPKP